MIKELIKEDEAPYIETRLVKIGLVRHSKILGEIPSEIKCANREIEGDLKKKHFNRTKRRKSTWNTRKGRIVQQKAF